MEAITSEATPGLSSPSSPNPLFTSQHDTQCGDSTQSKDNTQSKDSTQCTGITPALFQRELELEEEMLNRGYLRFMRQVEKARNNELESSTSYGKSLIKRGVEPLAMAITSFMEKAYSGAAGRRHKAAVMLKEIDPYVAAFITLRKMIDSISTKHDRLFQSIAKDIGREINLEMKLMILKEQDPERFSMTQNHIKGQNGYRYRRTVLTYAFGKSTTVDFEPWSGEDLLHLGTKLIDLTIQSTNLFIMTTVQHKGQNAKQYSKAYSISPTNECLAFIENNIESQSIMSPDFAPMIIPPRKWTGVFEGGYYNRTVCRLNFIKTNNRSYLNVIDKMIEKGELSEVTAAVNTLQETAWSINRNVYEVANQLWWNSRGGEAGLPLHDDERLPLCPVCGADVTDSADARHKHPCLEVLRETDPQAFKDWKREAARVRLRSATNFGRRLGVSKTLAIAKRYMNESAFYFPYQLDFRGRIYAVPPFLNPQGTQLAKGLLQFAQGKALGSIEAVRWLAIHGSNTFGNDKVSFDDRYSWVLQHQTEILNVAEDPYSCRWWMDADEPFCFLAFCYEWAGYVREGLSFISHLPIAMDGSCNGLQLFSLMLRDEVGGHAVNLTPEDTPQDIYAIVADKVRVLVQHDAEEGEALEVYSKATSAFLYERKTVANILLQIGINRKTTKRQVMVLPYGGTMQSCTEYTKKWLIERIEEDGFKWPEGVSIHGASIYLSRCIWECIGNTVIAAKDAMNFLQKLAKVVSSGNKPVRWTSPCGLPVLQEYKTFKSKRVRTMVGDAITYFTLNHETSTYDVKRQQNGVSPNFVHSLDASALVKTVCRAKSTGTDCFAMIHDSYGTHAANTAMLAVTLRQVFVDMFSENLLEKLLLEVKASLPMEEYDRLPPLPPVGSLDTMKVLESKFFFA
ncbi:MAG: DNA-directed RNA polymerase [Desulfovibrionaceae bacterium]